MSGIKDKVIAITGASRGIGEATAALLAERGAKVVLMALSSDKLRAVAGRIADAGGAVAHTTGDVRRREDPGCPRPTDANLRKLDRPSRVLVAALSAQETIRARS
jgi:NADP-dependent 3-hydroxy acid dehydrogenase YdfG